MLHGLVAQGRVGGVERRRRVSERQLIADDHTQGLGDLGLTVDPKGAHASAQAGLGPHEIGLQRCPLVPPLPPDGELLMCRLDLDGAFEHGRVGLVVPDPLLELFDPELRLAQLLPHPVALGDGLFGGIDEVGAQRGGLG